MTATEMGYEFDVGYDFITNLEAPGIEPREKSVFLTKAQEDLVRDILAGNAFVESNKRFVDILKTSDDLESFTTGPYGATSFWADLPTGVFAIINERATLTPTVNHFYYGKTLENVKVIPIDDDFYHGNKNNPFKKPSYDKIWRLDYGEYDGVGANWTSKVAYIIEENTTLTKVTLHYYRKPNPIIIKDSNYLITETIEGITLDGYTALDLDCELNPITHREIVDRAIKLAYAALQDEKGFQISSAKE
jgi:hypothetical protein